MKLGWIILPLIGLNRIIGLLLPGNKVLPVQQFMSETNLNSFAKHHFEFALITLMLDTLTWTIFDNVSYTKFSKHKTTHLNP